MNHSSFLLLPRVAHARGRVSECVPDLIIIEHFVSSKLGQEAAAWAAASARGPLPDYFYPPPLSLCFSMSMRREAPDSVSCLFTDVLA